MGTKNNPGQFDCVFKALPDEPIFSLLGRDPAAPVAIDAWIHERVKLGKNAFSDPKIQEALDCVNAMEAYEHDSNAQPLLGFDGALNAIKRGKKVARFGWNGQGMFLFLVPGSHFKVNRPPLLGIYPPETEIDYRPHIDMKTAQGDVVPWVASQSDLLATDWFIVD